LYTAESTFGDLDGATIADLGVGCGVLSIGAQMMGAYYGMGVDVDPDALQQAKANADDFDMQIDFIQLDVNHLVDPETGLIDQKRHCLAADTVIMNPPFGTKVKGIDMLFLELASQASTFICFLF
jgi:predicted RNA methylase